MGKEADKHIVLYIAISEQDISSQKKSLMKFKIS